MAGLSDVSEQDFLNHNFSIAGGAYTPPATHFISLHDADPGDTGTNEITGGGYARQQIATPATFWSAAAARTITSQAEVAFANMPAVGGGGITHVGIWSLVTGGVFMASDALTTPKTVSSGDTARFPAGSLQVLFDSVAFTLYLAHAWLDFQFRNTAYTRPSSHTLQIYDGDPLAAGTPIAGATPQAITFNAPSASAPRHDVTNNGVISFTNLTGGDTLNHWLVEDQLNNDLVSFNQSTQAIGAGDDVEFADQVLTIGID